MCYTFHPFVEIWLDGAVQVFENN